MARVKLNLSTGASVEKPVVTSFSVDSKSYMILDAENIGSMGLPIILVCKVEDNVVKKITDSAEWQQAKDYLKGIIAGNSMNYITVPAEMSADEVYYTQLTLPVASFDVIKNSYKVDEPVVETVPVVEPVAAEAPVIPEVQTAPASEPVVPEVQPVPAIDLEMPSNPVPTEPIIPAAPVSEPVIPVEPAITETSAVNNELDFAETKEAFMKACENMFDALLSKFQEELNSNK